MPSPTNATVKRKPDMVKSIHGCSVKLFFAQEDNEAALLLSKKMLSTSYAKNILLQKNSATLVDKHGTGMG